MSKSKPKPVFLVGMMGAGKSTVGPLLAKRLGRRFLDTDHEVEARAGRTIAAIFAAEGEARFRALEREAIERASGESAVVALGGGAIAQPGALERLKARGTLVYLSAPVERLLARIGDGADRPLLAGVAPAARLERLRELLAAREPFYAAADHAVDATGAPDEVVERIVEQLGDGEAT